jgi:hypothetical protein
MISLLKLTYISPTTHGCGKPYNTRRLSQVERYFDFPFVVDGQYILVGV